MSTTSRSISRLRQANQMLRLKKKGPRNLEDLVKRRTRAHQGTLQKMIGENARVAPSLTKAIRIMTWLRNIIKIGSLTAIMTTDPLPKDADTSLPTTRTASGAQAPTVVATNDVTHHVTAITISMIPGGAPTKGTPRTDTTTTTLATTTWAAVLTATQNTVKKETESQQIVATQGIAPDHSTTESPPQGGAGMSEATAGARTTARI